MASAARTEDEADAVHAEAARRIRKIRASRASAAWSPKFVLANYTGKGYELGDLWTGASVGWVLCSDCNNLTRASL
jgi:hypothetical protein